MIAEFSDTDSSGQEEQESRRSAKKQKIATKDKEQLCMTTMTNSNLKSEWSKKYPFVTRSSIRRLAHYGVKRISGLTYEGGEHHP